MNGDFQSPHSSLNSAAAQPYGAGCTYLLSREEEKDITGFLLTHVYLYDGADGCLEVVALGLGRVEYLHWVCPSGHGQQWAAVKV